MPKNPNNLVWPCLVGIHMKVMGDLLLEISENIESRFVKLEHLDRFKRYYDAMNEHTGHCLVELEKMEPELVEQICGGNLGIEH